MFHLAQLLLGLERLLKSDPSKQKKEDGQIAQAFCRERGKWILRFHKKKKKNP